MDLQQHCKPSVEAEDAILLQNILFSVDEVCLNMPEDLELGRLLSRNNSSPANTASQDTMEEPFFNFGATDDKSFIGLDDGGGDCILFPPSSDEVLDLGQKNLNSEQDLDEAHLDPMEWDNLIIVANEETIGPSESKNIYAGPDYHFEDLLILPHEITESLVFTETECNEIGVEFDKVDWVMKASAFGGSTRTQGSYSYPSEYNYDVDSSHVGSGNGCKRKSGTRKQKESSGATTGNKIRRRKNLLTSKSSEGNVTNTSQKGRKPTSSKGKKLSKESKMKRDVETFGHKLGPHFRIISAVMAVSGIRNVSETLTYGISQLRRKRFRPKNIYRTIYRSVVSPTEVTRFSMPDLEEPSWEQWKLRSPDDDLPAHLMGPSQRIYHSCPFGRQDESSFRLPTGGCLLSLPLDLETEEGNSTYSPEILTGVGSANLNVTLNVAELAKKCNNSEFLGPQQLLIIRLREPTCSALLYETGKLIVVGTTSFEEFRVAARKFARMIQKRDISVRLTELKLHFYLGFVKLPFRINLCGMKQHDSLADYVKHDFDIFPGVVFSVKVGDSKLLNFLFETGEILFADVQHPEEMKTALDLMYPCLRQFGY